MVVSAKTSVAARPASPVIQKPVAAHKNARPVAVDIAARSSAPRIASGRIAQARVTVARMRLGAMLARDSAIVRPVGVGRNVPRSVRQERGDTSAAPNASVSMVIARMTQERVKIDVISRKSRHSPPSTKGRCRCQPGFTGVKCERQCDEQRWGRDCASLCQCGTGSCNPTDGTCRCPPGRQL